MAAILAVLLLAGVAIAGYLAVHHENHVYGDATLSLANCPETETINCDVVNSSGFSEVLGVPIAAFAIPTYLLLLGMLAVCRRNPAVLAHVFTIGLLCVAYSAFLFVVSKTVVGYLCLWCMRLYAVNLSIPILSAFAARRSPQSLVAATFHDLRRFRPAVVRAGAAFVVLLGITVAGDRALRAHVKAQAAAERHRIEQEGGPTVPAVPETPSGPSSGLSLVPPAYADEKPAPPAPYKLAGPLRKLDGGKAAPFDLQGRLGKGKPVALIFWAPNFAWSERSLVSMAQALAKDYPAFEVYAVAGKRDDQKDEDLVERFAMLEVPASLPLLADDGFAVSKALAVEDVPNVAVFSAMGQLVVAKIKSPDQLLITGGGNKPASDVLQQVAKGAEVPQIQRMFPYYPGSELVGHCAPPFRGKTFGTGAPYAFTGKGNGRPTLVMFWSSTCKHCQVDVPQLVKWVKAHPNAADIVGVTIIKKDQAGQPSHRAITEQYIKAQGISWTVVEDPDGVVTRTYRSISTPTTFFVSPSGTVTDVWYYAHEEGFDAAMDRSLATAKAGAATACSAPAEPDRPALSMSVMSSDGKRIELAKAVGGPTLVHFWATWCKPCVAELPSLVKFRDTIEKAGTGKVVLVSVEGEEDGKRITDFQKTLGVDLHSYRAPQGGVAGKIDPAFRVPRTYVVDGKGGVLEERQGAQDWADPAFAEGIKAWLDAAR